jgi:hypothetical protein
LHRHVIVVFSVAVAQKVAHEFVGGRHFGEKLDVAGDVDVAVGVDAPVKSELRPRVQLDVLVAEHAELEERDQVVVHLALQAHLPVASGACRGGGQDVRRDRSDQSGERA